MKAILKSAAECVAFGLVLPAAAAYHAARLAFGAPRAWPFYSQAMCLIPGTIGAYLRRAFLRTVFPHCGNGSWISFGTIFSHPDCRIGRNAYVGCYCCLGAVTLGDDVLIGSHVSVTNGSAQHGTARLDIPMREQPGEWPHVTIGADTWVGDRAVIMADVGSHCIIGAGAVVTQPIPDYAVAVGVPARVVRFRNEIPAETGGT